MSNLNYIRQYYNLPWLKCGMRVDFDGKPGRIIGATSSGGHLRVKLDELDAQGKHHIVMVHPTWHMTYFSRNGKVLADFAEQGVSA